MAAPQLACRTWVWLWLILCPSTRRTWVWLWLTPMPPALIWVWIFMSVPPSSLGWCGQEPRVLWLSPRSCRRRPGYLTGAPLSPPRGSPRLRRWSKEACASASFVAGRTLRLGDPAGGGIGGLPEEEVQLGCVVLDVSHVVQQKLQLPEVEPVEDRAPARRLVGEDGDLRVALLAAMLEIGVQLLFRIHPFREHARRIELVEGERHRRNELLDRARQVEVEEEERVIDRIPVLRPPRAVAPQLAGTGEQGVFEHVDGGSELLPEGLSPGRVHVQPPASMTSLNGSREAYRRGLGMNREGEERLLFRSGCTISVEECIRLVKARPAGLSVLPDPLHRGPIRLCCAT